MIPWSRSDDVVVVSVRWWFAVERWGGGGRFDLGRLEADLLVFEV